MADDPNRGCSRWKESRLTWLSCFMSPCTQPRSAKSVLVCVLAPHPGTNRVPSVLIGYLTAHTMSSHFDAPARFYSRSAPSTQTPVPDRATSQHPPNSHKTNINASSRAQQSSEIPNPTNLRNRTAPPFRRSSSCAPRRPIIWEHPSRGLGQGYVGTRSPPRSGPRVFVEMR